MGDKKSAKRVVEKVGAEEEAPKKRRVAGS